MNKKYDKTKSDLEEEKRRRDVNNVCRYARFVICVNRDGLIVNIIDREEWSAAIIAVVCVEDCFGEEFIERVLLEIGFNRTRPYNRIEQDGKWLMYERRIEKPFLLNANKAVYRALLECIEKVVIESCAKWETERDWFVAGIGYVPRGISFTVSRHDEFLFRQMIVEDLRRQQGRNIDKHVRLIKGWIGHYKRVDFTAKQLKLFGGSCKVAELLTTYEERPRHRDVLLRSFSEGTKVRMIIDRIVEVFNIDFTNVDPESELLRKRFIVEHPRDFIQSSLWVRLRKQPSVHAKGCLVAEIGVVDQSKISKMKEVMNGNVQSGTSP